MAQLLIDPTDDSDYRQLMADIVSSPNPTSLGFFADHLLDLARKFGHEGLETRAKDIQTHAHVWGEVRETGIWPTSIPPESGTWTRYPEQLLHEKITITDLGHEWACVFGGFLFAVRPTTDYARIATGCALHPVLWVQPSPYALDHWSASRELRHFPGYLRLDNHVQAAALADAWRLQRGVPAYWGGEEATRCFREGTLSRQLPGLDEETVAAMQEMHRMYARMGRCRIRRDRNVFTQAELAFLEANGRWVEALTSGQLQPFTLGQADLVRVHQGTKKPETVQEHAWKKNLDGLEAEGVHLVRHLPQETADEPDDIPI